MPATLVKSRLTSRQKNVGRRAVVYNDEILPPGRPLKVSDKMVFDCIHKGLSVLETAGKLGITAATVYNRLRNRGIKPPPKDNTLTDAQSVKFVQSLKGTISMDQFAAEWRLSSATMRNRLSRGIEVMFGQTYPKSSPMRWLAKPRLLREIKIVNLLCEQPELFDDPDEIQKLTNLTELAVNRYLDRVVSK